MNYTTENIVRILAPKLASAKFRPARMTQVLTDSRQLIDPAHTLFFALQGQRSDGHQFIAELYTRGVRNFVVARTIENQALAAANFYVVDQPILALQQLASYHRQQFNLPVIGITGSNGKTIVKEWLFQLLRESFNIVRSPKSYNSQIGVPLSVLQIEAAHDLGLFEAGISTRSEMQNLAPIVDCSIGVFTNIGPAHDEGFDHRREKIQEKLLLFSKVNTLIFDLDEEILAEEILTHFPREKCFTCSRKQAADLQILSIHQEATNFTRLEAIYQQKKQSIQFPFTDAASLQNGIHCWATLLVLGLEEATIRQRMLRLEPVAMRLELKAAINRCTLINDSYNSDLASLNIALHFLEQQKGAQMRVVILSDILQSGQESEALYATVAQLLKARQINWLIGIGSTIPAITAYLPEIKTQFFADTASFLRQFPFSQLREAIILLKGARAFAFEQIANRLAHKNHNTTLEINLNALLHNLNVFSQKLKADTKMMVMVKAAAYGSGGDEIARLLAFQQVDYLAVAYADEGVQLRQAGIQLPILVLNPEEATFDALLRYQLEPEIYSLGQLKKLLAYLPETDTLAIHLKLDTGMHRLGFDATTLDELCEQLKQHPQLEVRSIFSHLAASEATEHDAFTHEQYAQFEQYYAFIVSVLGYRPLRHLLNSSGITRFPQYQMDMVRLGIGLYGIAAEGEQLSLERVHTLKASISQIRIIKAGQSIGYGRAGRAEQDMRVATISIGYADGLLRKAGNGNYQLSVLNQLVPTIGNICMDMAMIDISTVPAAKEGDEVVVFGEYPRVEQLSTCLETIPYEVFTGISERVKRVYFLE